MCCSRRKQIAKKSLFGYLRRFKDLVMKKDLKLSESHRQKWQDYDKVLMYRSNFSMVARLTSDLLVFFFGSQHHDQTEIFLEKGGPPSNADLANKIFNVAKSMALALIFTRILLLAISFRKLKVCKIYYYYEFVVFLVDMLLPQDNGAQE